MVYSISLPLIGYATSLSDLSPSEQENTYIFKQVAPLVVNVHNIQKITTDFFNAYDIPAGVGSGFIWNREGHIVTNFHVIHGANNIVVSGPNGQTMPAQVLGVAPHKDIAVLKLTSKNDIIKLENLNLLRIADSSKLLVGQKAIAIGNPFGLDQTMTVGTVSALNRKILGIAGVSIRDMIQTDASINPGNSGGPLLDSQGRLIGMTTMIYSNSGSSAGIGFAVPSNTIKNTVEQLIRYGKVIQPGLGIQLLGDQIAYQLGIKGVIISEIIPNSPAEKAGLLPTYRDSNGRIHLGDAIIAIDNQPIDNYDDLFNTINTKQIGQEITATILRNGKTQTIPLKIVDISLLDNS